VLSKELKRDSDYLEKIIKKRSLGALTILFFKKDKIVSCEKEKVLLCKRSLSAQQRAQGRQ
jgi:hypothetical protein